MLQLYFDSPLRMRLFGGFVSSRKRGLLVRIICLYMMERKLYRLNFEMVPEECWYKNLRSFLSPKDWDIVRKDAYRRAESRCMICKRKVSRLEAHEKWSYDEARAIQKLEDVVALCHACHSVVHISRTQLIGRGDEAMEHFMKVNHCSQSDYHTALAEANNEYLKRNKIECWQTDISWLKDKIDLNKYFLG